MRIYWDTGTRTYDSAREVKEELTRRGLLEVSLAPVAVEDTPEAQVHIAMERQRKEGVWRQDPVRRKVVVPKRKECSDPVYVL